MVVEKTEEPVPGMPQQMPAGFQQLFGGPHYRMDIKILEFKKCRSGLAVDCIYEYNSSPG